MSEFITSSSPKMLVIHRALAPYRIDLFNALYQHYGCDIYFEEGSAENHTFQNQVLQERIHFPYRFLKSGRGGIKNLRTEILSIAEQGQYSIVLTSEINLTTLLAWFAKKRSHSPCRLISIVDDSLSIAEEETRKRFSLKKLLFKKGWIDGVLLCDSRTQTHYTKQWGRPDMYHTLPIIQSETWIRDRLTSLYNRAQTLRSQYVHDEKDRVLLYVGRLSPEKNLPRLIKVFCKTFAPTEHIHLLLVGDGTQESTLRQQARESLCSSRIHFAGRKEGDDLYSHYLLADVFVLASCLERFGAVANEALIIGIPSVISTATGIRSMLSEESGKIVFFDPLSQTEMATALRKVLEEIPAWQACRPSLMPSTLDALLPDLYNFLEGNDKD